MYQFVNFEICPSAQDIKSIGLGKTFTWDLFIVFPYQLLSLYLGSISHKFSIWKFLLISEHETTASYRQFGISFSISSRPRNMLYHLVYSYVLAIYSSCLWRLTAQRGKRVFWKLGEFNCQLCSHGLSSKVLGLITGNFTFGSVHCCQVEAWKKKNPENKTPAYCYYDTSLFHLSHPAFPYLFTSVFFHCQKWYCVCGGVCWKVFIKYKIRSYQIQNSDITESHAPLL